MLSKIKSVLSLSRGNTRSPIDQKYYSVKTEFRRIHKRLYMVRKDFMVSINDISVYDDLVEAKLEFDQARLYLKEQFLNRSCLA